MTRKINNSYLLGQSNAPTTGGNMFKTRSDGTPVWEEVDAMALVDLSWNGGRGVVAGGYAAGGVGDMNSIEYITIATTGNGTDFGNLSVAKTGVGGVSSSVRGVMGGGSTPSKINVIEYVTIASTGDVTDFGDFTAASNRASVCTNTRGVYAGGATPSTTTVIDYITIASTGDGTDFGDLITGRSGWTGGISDSHGGLA